MKDLRERCNDENTTYFKRKRMAYYNCLLILNFINWEAYKLTQDTQSVLENRHWKF
jgi:hypothetical protein